MKWMLSKKNFPKREAELEEFEPQKLTHHLSSVHQNLRMETALDEFFQMVEQKGVELVESTVNHYK